MLTPARLITTLTLGIFTAFILGTIYRKSQKKPKTMKVPKSTTKTPKEPNKSSTASTKPRQRTK